MKGAEEDPRTLEALVFDELFLTVRNRKEAMFVDDCNVASTQPTIWSEYLSGSLRIVCIASANVCQLQTVEHL